MIKKRNKNFFDSAVTVPTKLDKTETEAEETFVAGSPPKFVKLPTDSLVAEGETAIFECAVIGEPKPELKWFSDSGEIVKSERILVSVFVAKFLSLTLGQGGILFIKLERTVMP